MAQKSYIMLEASRLRSFVAEVFQKLGLGEGGSSQAADVLCTADEWGIRTHGIIRLKAYVKMLQSGCIDAKAVPSVERSISETIAFVNGENALGMTVAAFASNLAADIAGRKGVGVVCVRNSNHFGIAGYYAARHLPRFTTIVLTNTPPIVAPPNGRDRHLGTNPIAVAFPSLKQGDLVLDTTTSDASLGIIETALRTGSLLRHRGVRDLDGKPSSNPEAFLAGGSIFPLGGPESGHKGFCLAAMVDLLCGVLTGAAWGPYVPTFLNGSSGTPIGPGGKGTGHLFISFSNEHFGGFEELGRRVDTWIDALREARRLHPDQPIIIPGDLEKFNALRALKVGVAIDRRLLYELRSLGKELMINANNEFV